MGESGPLQEDDIEVAPYTEVGVEVVVAFCSGTVGSVTAAKQPPHYTPEQDQWSGMTPEAWTTRWCYW